MQPNQARRLTLESNFTMRENAFFYQVVNGYGNLETYFLFLFSFFFQCDCQTDLNTVFENKFWLWISFHHKQ
jgi:hypothetical protein